MARLWTTGFAGTVRLVYAGDLGMHATHHRYAHQSDKMKKPQVPDAVSNSMKHLQEKKRLSDTKRGHVRFSVTHGWINAHAGRRNEMVETPGVLVAGVTFPVSCLPADSAV